MDVCLLSDQVTKVLNSFHRYQTLLYTRKGSTPKEHRTDSISEEKRVIDSMYAIDEYGVSGRMTDTSLIHNGMKLPAKSSPIDGCLYSPQSPKVDEMNATGPLTGGQRIQSGKCYGTIGGK